MREVVDPVNDDQAIDAALVAFLDCAEDASLRTKLVAAVEAHAAAVRRCPSCLGAKTVVKRGGVVFVEDAHGRVGQQVADGEQMTCVVCGGHGVDLTRVVWTCRLDRGYPCRSDQRRDADHVECGWALDVQQPDGPSS